MSKKVKVSKKVKKDSGKKVSVKNVSKEVEKSNLGKRKIRRTMEEFKEGELHSGSTMGPLVTNPKQAIAISLSVAKKAVDKKKKKSKKK